MFEYPLLSARPLQDLTTGGSQKFHILDTNSGLILALFKCHRADSSRVSASDTGDIVCAVLNSILDPWRPVSGAE